jgi:hypothetical protein
MQDSGESSEDGDDAIVDEEDEDEDVKPKKVQICMSICMYTVYPYVFTHTDVFNEIMLLLMTSVANKV